jgi:uncharacterized protein with von Willebrand factor type A (vWA) domain
LLACFSREYFPVSDLDEQYLNETRQVRQTTCRSVDAFALTHSMKIVERVGQFQYDLFDCWLGQRTEHLHVFAQFAALTQFHDEMESLGERAERRRRRDADGEKYLR